MIHLLDQINEKESEEFHKNIISKFLDKTYYAGNHYINTKGRNDLVIHNGQDAKTGVGVIIETKKPTNRGEMLQKNSLNVKAFQELVLYYLRERITHGNLEVHYLVVTNIYEWFIFDVEIFEKAFAQDKTLAKQFQDFEEGRLAGKNTDFFYKEIAEPAIEKLLTGKSKAGADIVFTHFDIRDYEKILRNKEKSDDKKLIAFFKLLSPEHLLKLPFKNDSNNLDKVFYSELLHIIGLTEIKEKGKKLIGRKEKGERDSGSILENAINQLRALDKISRLEKPTQYGSTEDDRYFNVGLELVITWINRILFLKLLEAQLITYHKGDNSYTFLNSGKIRNFDDLNTLFFQVLARQIADRDTGRNDVFSKIPYLNSSLFEPTDLEHAGLFISQLQPDKELSIFTNTVLKDNRGKKRSGNFNTLDYLFSFLDAYDFSSEGYEEIQEENKTLISASVLGLIFEKINGYKDGSFFTPGFVTMYMCRETIRKTVIQKFNDTKGWNCISVDELYDKIEDKKEANKIINSLKICDPAVGSGHFLVSALNELIAVKSDLKILLDRQGRTLRDYRVEVANDELAITDEDGNLIEYNPRNKESQRVQEALFHEKQTLIEGSLFGIDINSNSAKICRLRLWIELLKHAYYKEDSDNELETLPNIDINIQWGNSLISRFPLDVDISQALKKSKITMKKYRQAFQDYRHAANKEEKREMKQLIERIKSDFRTEISDNDPKVKKLRSKRGDLDNLLNQHSLFELSKAEQKQKKKLQQELEQDIEKLTKEIEEIKSNKIFENAFEWRFEFPEVLDDNGNFHGFDLLIGNPPYGIKFSDQELGFLKSRYISSGKTNDSYSLFIELAHRLSSANGLVSYIVPTGWYTGANFGALRRYFAQNTDPITFINLPYDVFADAWVDTTIFITKRRQDSLPWPRTDDHKVMIKIFDKKESIESFLSFYKGVTTTKFSSWFESGSDEYVLLKDNVAGELINKIKSKSKPLSTYADIQRGVTPFHLTDTPAHQNSKPAFSGTVRRYKFEKGEKKYLRYDESLAEFKPEKYFKGERLLLRELISRQFELQAIKTKENFITNKSMQSIIANAEYSSNYLLAFINSRLMSWYFLNISQIAQRDDFPKIVLKETRQLPVYPIDLKSQKNEYDKINSLVEEVISAKKMDLAADTSNLEKQIDQIIYSLYDLKPEEIDSLEKK